MSNTIVSLIRTYVPVAVGAGIAWLLTLGVQVDAEAQTGLVTGLTGVLIAAYYAVARALEARWPWLGVLLGVPVVPEYDRRTETERLIDAEARADAESILAALDHDPRVTRPDPDDAVRWDEPDTKGRHEA